MLKHWNKKHNQAYFVPLIASHDEDANRQYRYGNKIILGTGTDFQFFLRQMATGVVYYDPGIKLENISKNPTHKARSQFRVKSGNLGLLYKNYETVVLPAGR